MRRPDQLPDEVQRDLAAIDAALAGEPADGELAELALLVRDQRPRLDPGARARLDERADARFAARRVRAPRRRALLPALGAAATILVVSVGVYGGLGARDAGEPVAPGGEAATRTAPSAERARESADEAASAPSSATAAPVAPSAGLPSRSVQRAAELLLATTPGRLDEVAGAVMRTTEALGGYVAGSAVHSRGGRGGSASFQLRVPSARLETALARLSRLARVRSRNTSSLDVTGAVVSARDRVSALEAERRGVLRQLAAAGTPEETEAARARLRAVDVRLARAKAHREELRRRVAYSTIDVELVTERRAGAGSGTNDHWTPGDGLRVAVRVLEIAAGAMLVALALLLPAALLAALGFGAWRVVRSRRREAALDGAA